MRDGLVRRPLAVAAAMLAALPAAQAANGQIDNFGASALQVLVGDTVTFTVDYSASTSVFQDGGSDLNEPAPAEGYQTWVLNWYDFQYETLQSISLQADGQSFLDSPALGPGNGHAGSWTFSVLFPLAGSFNVTIGGDWTVLHDVQQGAELASRNCYNNNYDGGYDLVCDSWTYEYPQYGDYYTETQSLGSMTLQIDVLQAVPEPQAWALWLLGGGLLARRVRQGRSTLRH
jgi:hypothetical protein